MNLSCPLRGFVTALSLTPLLSLTSGNVAAELVRSPTSIETLSSPSMHMPQVQPREIMMAARSNPVSRAEAEIYLKINQYRVQRGLQPLMIDPVLSQQARSHSQAMASGKRAFSHEGFEARQQVISRALSIQALAENVAYNQGYRYPVNQAIQGWLQSSGHHANIVGSYNKTGIGVAVGSDGKYYFTQIFGASRV